MVPNEQNISNFQPQSNGVGSNPDAVDEAVQQRQPQRPPRPPRRARMRLPFDDRKQDAGEWAYDHRIGLSVMVIAYLLMGIAFFASKIVIGSKPHTQGIYVDMQTLEALEEEKQRLEQEIAMNQSDVNWSTFRNRQSNDALLNEGLRDDRGTNTSEINESAQGIAAGMAANRAAYEAGLAEAQSILNAQRTRPSEGESRKAQEDVKYAGGVTVRFEFKDPVRTKRNLVVPAYKCESGGEVVVAVVLNQGGEVVSARVTSGGDERMREEALKAARASLFNIDNSAPARHSGTITYVFIPQ